MRGRPMAQAIAAIAVAPNPRVPDSPDAIIAPAAPTYANQCAVAISVTSPQKRPPDTQRLTLFSLDMKRSLPSVRVSAAAAHNCICCGRAANAR
jgi:hypothetical protein